MGKSDLRFFIFGQIKFAKIEALLKVFIHLKSDFFVFDLASFLTRFEFSFWYIQLVCDQIKEGNF